MNLPDRTPEQKIYDAQVPKDKVESIEEVIRAVDGKNALVVLPCEGNVRAREVVLRALRIDIGGYSHILDSSAAKHALNKHKGDPIPLEKAHFGLIVDTIMNADEIVCGRKNRRNLDTIIYVKNYENIKVFYVEEIRNGRHQLAMNTMYLNKVKR